MSGNDTAVSNGKLCEIKIQNKILGALTNKSEYSLKSQYSYSFGNADCNKSNKLKIDFCITKNVNGKEIPYVFVEVKSQKCGGTASEKAPIVLSNFVDIVENNNVEHCIMYSETDQPYYGFTVFDKDLNKKPTLIKNRIHHINNSESALVNLLNNIL